MNGGEIIGDIAQGALTARAIEPDHGESAGDGHSHESACLNCGTALVGTHCHACGQAAHVHKTLGAFFHDFLHGVFHFEGKIWRTLPMLAWNPGKLTREYIDGRRASYVSPIALFLFVVFLTFAMFNLATGPVHIGEGSTEATAKQLAADLDKANQEVNRLESQRAALRASGKPTEALDSELAGAVVARDTIEALSKKQLPTVKFSSDAPGGDRLVRQLDAQWKRVKQNPDLALYKLQSSAYKYSWLLIPLSVPFVWLLFPFNRRFGLYDHTVFVTYSLSFMFVLLTVLSVLGGWNPWGISGGLGAALLAYAPVHIYRQVRGTYGVGKLAAAWRTLVLSWVAIIVVTIWAVTLLGMVMAAK